MSGMRKLKASGFERKIAATSLGSKCGRGRVSSKSQRRALIFIKASGTSVRFIHQTPSSKCLHQGVLRAASPRRDTLNTAHQAAMIIRFFTFFTLVLHTLFMTVHEWERWCGFAAPRTEFACVSKTDAAGKHAGQKFTELNIVDARYTHTGDSFVRTCEGVICCTAPPTNLKYE